MALIEWANSLAPPAKSSTLEPFLSHREHEQWQHRFEPLTMLLTNLRLTCPKAWVLGHAWQQFFQGSIYATILPKEAGLI